MPAVTIGVAMAAPFQPAYRRVAGAALVASLILLPAALAGPARAADPSAEPTPIVFSSPQYLVFWESHMTYDGPVTDNAYALFTAPPVEPGHFVVPDGSGGVFHYSGRLVGGPYASDTELCPQMLSLGIEALQVWPPALIGGSTIVDCERFRATPAPTSAPPAPTSVVSSGDGGGGTADAGGSSGPGAPMDPARTAAAVGGLALAGAGAVGLLRRGTRPSGTRRADGPARRPAPADPCADQAGELAAATANGRMINDLLQTNRRVLALLDRQIIQLANVMIPGSFGLDVAFLLGGAWGSKVGWGFVPKELLAKALDGAIKDVVKELAKQGLDAYGQRQLELEAFEAQLGKVAEKGKEGGAKAFIKDLLRDSLQARESARRFATPSMSAEQLNARLKMLKNYSESMSGPIADALGHVLSMYNAGIGVATLNEQLDILRIKRDAVLDQTSTLEMDLESALEKAQFARERLNHCRFINSPDWRP